MATEKEMKLVEQLLDKTKKRILSWEPTAAEDELLATFGGHVSFTIRWRPNGVVLVMRDQHDRLLLTIDSRELDEVSTLYAEARRQALNAEDALDDVLEQLTRLDRR
jgi:phage terminase Nu1 subunit (DNA packaging protein)